MKTNKIPFKDIKVGMKFYKFKDDEEYDIYYVIGKYIRTVTENNLREIVTIRGEKSICPIYIDYQDDYIKSDNYILIDGYTTITLKIYKIKNDNRLMIDNINDEGFVINGYTSTIKLPKSCISDEFDMNTKVSLYSFTNKSTIKFLSHIIDSNIISDISNAIRPYISKILFKDNPILHLLWSYTIFDNIPSNYIIGNKMTLRKYTTDYPDNVIPKEYMDYIITNSNITKAITNYRIFEYDESIDLSNIKYDYLVIYCVKDDKFYIMLYTTGESLYKLNYESDKEIKEVVDFMLRRRKK